MMTALAAAKAYAAAQNQAIKPPGGAQETDGLDFGAMVKNAMTDMTQQSKAAETQMTQSIQGNGNLIDVVTALSSAEASLETVISVRDQVISAYKEIMAMPI
ncbi:MAG: flagellar hook-basal body complex protein FliE [Brevundimonas sp.]